MDHIEQDDVVELGVASEETKGTGIDFNDLPSGQPVAGILDD
jgi:hypothetical protein